MTWGSRKQLPHLYLTSKSESRQEDKDDRSENRNDTIPLTAIPVNQIAMLYPMAQIAKLLKSAQRVTQGERSISMSEVSTFLDFNNRSIVLKVLRTKLW
jgi:hypothetical protein